MIRVHSRLLMPHTIPIPYLLKIMMGPFKRRFRIRPEPSFRFAEAAIEVTDQNVHFERYFFYRKNGTRCFEGSQLRHIAVFADLQTEAALFQFDESDHRVVKQPHIILCAFTRQ